MGYNRQQLEQFLSTYGDEILTIIRRNSTVVESMTSNPSSSHNVNVNPQSHALGSNQEIGRTIAQQLNRAYSTGTDQGQLLHCFRSELLDDVAQDLDKVNRELQRKRDANDIFENPEGMY
jgi:tRNA1(Val) A37 N6-methylase TrmN6